MRKNLSIMGALSLSVALLAGCNGDDSSGGSSSSTGASKAAATSSQNSGKSSTAAGGAGGMKLPLHMKALLENRTKEQAVSACTALLGTTDQFAASAKHPKPSGKVYSYADGQPPKLIKGDVWGGAGLAGDELYCEVYTNKGDGGAYNGSISVALRPDAKVEGSTQAKQGNILWDWSSDGGSDAEYAALETLAKSHFKDVVE